FNEDGFDKEGYDKGGFDYHGFDRTEFDRDGFDRAGYNKEGHDRLAHDTSKTIIIDTETTGLDSDAEIVEIAVIDAEDGKVLLDTLIKPSATIPLQATKIHNITNEDVRDAPSWAEIHNQFLDVIKDKDIIIYNSEFDTKLINQTARIRGCEAIDFSMHNVQCAMLRYAKYWKEPNSYYGGFKWQKLTSAIKQQNIDINDLQAHRAAADCEMTRRLILKVGENLGFGKDGFDNRGLFLDLEEAEKNRGSHRGSIKSSSRYSTPSSKSLGEKLQQALTSEGIQSLAFLIFLLLVVDRCGS
ncbi:3'-5' exonuclease, partial [bacterium]|nr:3'-5' exonuclease [bacterium]